VRLTQFFNTDTVNTTTIDSLLTSDPNDQDPKTAGAFSAGVATFSVTNATVGAGNTVVAVTALTDNTSSSYTVNATTATRLVAILPGQSFTPGTSPGKTGTPRPGDGRDAVQRYGKSC